MNKETLRMQMLAGIITEGQYKEKMEEIDSMGKIGKSYPAPETEKMADTTSTTSISPSLEESGKKELREKAIDLYRKMLDHKKITYSSSDWIDSVIQNSVPDKILHKVAKKNGGSLGIGMMEVIKSEFLSEKELKEIIRILKAAFDFAEKSKEYEVDFYYLGYDRNKGKWYDSRDEEED